MLPLGNPGPDCPVRLQTEHYCTKKPTALVREKPWLGRFARRSWEGCPDARAHSKSASVAHKDIRCNAPVRSGPWLDATMTAVGFSGDVAPDRHPADAATND